MAKDAGQHVGRHAGHLDRPAATIRAWLAETIRHMPSVGPEHEQVELGGVVVVGHAGDPRQQGRTAAGTRSSSPRSDIEKAVGDQHAGEERLGTEWTATRRAARGRKRPRSRWLSDQNAEPGGRGEQRDVERPGLPPRQEHPRPAGSARSRRRAINSGRNAQERRAERSGSRLVGGGRGMSRRGNVLRGMCLRGSCPRRR